jgi:LysM repeat protein
LLKKSFESIMRVLVFLASRVMTHPTRLSLLGLTATAALLMSGCGSTQQHMNLSAESLATPPHNMSHVDYPFDPSGHYVDSWAAMGAGRYGHRVNTDRQDAGRTPRKTTPPKAKPSSRPKSSTKKPATKARTHTVRPGESLYSLSRRYGVSMQALKRANGLKSDLIRDGRKLVIPR